MNKNEHLGSYRLFDKVRFQGYAISKNRKTNAFRCFECGSKTDGNVCQYCEPIMYQDHTLKNRRSLT